MHRSCARGFTDVIADPKAKEKCCTSSNQMLLCVTLRKKTKPTTPCQLCCNLTLIANCILISEMLKCEEKKKSAS